MKNKKPKQQNEWIVYGAIPPETKARLYDFNKPIEISDVFTDVEFNEIIKSYKNFNK